MTLQHIPLSVQTWTIQQLAFHVVSLLFEYADHLPAAQTLRVRKPDRMSFTRLLPRVLINQCFILLPSMLAAQHFGYCFTGTSHLPLLRLVISMPAMAIGHDVVQYLAHRYLLHSPSIWMMRFLRHSMHHATTASRGISACYMTGADFFLEIVLPYLVPLAVVGGGGADARFHFLVAALGAIGGVYEHSGYDLAVAFKLSAKETESPLLHHVIASVLGKFFDNRAHGEHHARGKVSFADGFGSPGLCDTLFGTRWDLSARRQELAEKEWRRQ